MKFNQKGFSHHLLFLIIPLIAIVGVGAYVISKSNAASPVECVNMKVPAAGYIQITLNNKSGKNLNMGDIRMRNAQGVSLTISQLSSSSGPWKAVTLANGGTTTGSFKTTGSIDSGWYAAFVVGNVTANTIYSNVCTKVVNSVNPTPTPPTNPSPTSPATPVSPSPAVILPTYTCTDLKLIATGSFGNRYQVAIKNTHPDKKIAMDFAKFKFRSGTPATSVDTSARGPIAYNTTLQATFDAPSNAGIDAGWYGAYVYDATHTIRVNCTKYVSTTSPTSAPPQPTSPAVSPSTSPTVVDTKPYTTLPAAPSENTVTYKAYKAWSDAINANKGLSGQALVDKLKPFKDTYDKEYTIAKAVSCTAVLPSAIELGKPVKTSLKITSKYPTTIGADTFSAALSEKYDGSTDLFKAVSSHSVPAIASNNTAVVDVAKTAYQQANGKKVTLELSLRKRSDPNYYVVGCGDSYKTYDLSSGKSTATTPPSSIPTNITIGGPSSPVGPTSPSASTAPTATAKKKVADLGYGDNLVLQCVNRNGQGSSAIWSVVPCGTDKANAALVIIGGQKKKPGPEELTYALDIARDTKDTFGKITGCSERTIWVNGKKIVYPCTIAYIQDTWISATYKSIVNRLKSIVSNTKTSASGTEARGSIDRIKQSDAQNATANITLTYKDYEKQVVSRQLIVDVNEASYIKQVIDAAKAACKSPNTFNTTTYACTPPAPTGGSDGSDNTGDLNEAKCKSLGRKWDNSSKSCKKECQNPLNRIQPGNPYDGCVPRGTQTSGETNCTHYGGIWIESKCNYFKCPAGYPKLTLYNSQWDGAYSGNITPTDYVVNGYYCEKYGVVGFAKPSVTVTN